MTPISVRLSEYLDYRRRFGADMTSVGLILKPFAAFADAEGAEWLTVELILRWKERFGSAGQTHGAPGSLLCAALRVGCRGLMNATKSHPTPKGLIPSCRIRPRPWIYSEAEVEQIVLTAAALPSPSGLRGATCSTLFGLIAVTGLRISEALGLDDEDVDAVDATLAVRHAKNGNCRRIPVTRCVVTKLQTYQQFRDRVATHAGSGALFRARNGERTNISSTEWNFAKVCQAVGLREPSPGKGRGLRIHDLRHAMATRTILDWFRQGRDVDAEMYKRSAYLGHQRPSGTFFGTSRQCQNCWRWRANEACEPSGMEVRHDQNRADTTGAAGAAVLHRAAYLPTRGQCEHDRKLPRYLSTTA